MIPIETLKKHMTVFHNLDDDLIELYRDAAIEYVEGKIERVLFDTEFTDTFKSFGEMVLRTPVASVSTIRFMNDQLKMQTVSNTVYQAEAGLDGGVKLRAQQSWPQVSTIDPVVTVRYRAGFTVETLPKTLFLAVLSKTLDIYNNREASTFVKAENFERPFDFYINKFKKHLI